MQLHEAATKYLEHRQQLINDPDSNAVVWELFHYIQGGKVVYRLALNPACGGPIPDPADPAYSDARHITLQRGGVRYFRSLDAVAAALLQIGQHVLPLWDVPKPDGL